MTVLSTRDIIPIDPLGEIMWDALTEEEAANLRPRFENERRMKNAARLRNLQHVWRFIVALAAAAIILTLLAVGALPAGAHDLAAWSDPARDQWYRSLKVPGQSTSCCDFTDAAAMNPDMVRQENDGSWSVDLGAGFVPVPPERVVSAPVSIDGLPYIFMMATPTVDSPNGIRCLIPPVGTY